MMKILVINGPNINMLGIREKNIYGTETYEDLLNYCKEEADKLGLEVSFFQSNHEGALVDAIQEAYGKIDGIVINPAAYTHTSVAILDAIRSSEAWRASTFAVSAASRMMACWSSGRL